MATSSQSGSWPIVGIGQRHHGGEQGPDHEKGPQGGQNPSDEVRRSDHGPVGWLLIIVVVLTLVAVPTTLAAVAVRPSQATVRAAGVTLLAFVVVVVMTIVIGALG